MLHSLVYIHRARYIHITVHNIARLCLEPCPQTNGKTSIARLFTVRLKYANNPVRRTKLVTRSPPLRTSVRRGASRRSASPRNHSRIRKPSHNRLSLLRATPVGPQKPSVMYVFAVATPGDARGDYEGAMQSAELHFNFIGSTLLLRVSSSRAYSPRHKLSAIETSFTFVKQRASRRGEDCVIILHIHLQHRRVEVF